MIFPTQGSNPGLLHCRQILTNWATRETTSLDIVLKIIRALRLPPQQPLPLPPTPIYFRTNNRKWITGAGTKVFKYYIVFVVLGFVKRTPHIVLLRQEALTYIFSSVQSLSCVQLFATPWTAAHQASLSTTNFWSLLKLMPIGSGMPPNHLILCPPLLLPPSIFPSIGVFSDESGSCHVPLELFLQSKHLEIFTTP